MTCRVIVLILFSSKERTNEILGYNNEVSGIETVVVPLQTVNPFSWPTCRPYWKKFKVKQLNGTQCTILKRPCSISCYVAGNLNGQESKPLLPRKPCYLGKLKWQPITYSPLCINIYKKRCHLQKQDKHYFSWKR